MESVVTRDELWTRLDDPHTRIADARYSLKRPDAGRAAYAREHIPGAVYLDLERDLSGPPGTRGRHPLPDPDTLARRLGELGIGTGHRVIAYDDGEQMFAARLWWLLRYLGHDDVSVLDGGFPAWRDAGLPVTSERPTHPRAIFEARVRDDLVAAREDVERMIDDREALLVDARAPARYRGDEEPIDPRAGHIPSAINLPHGDALDAGHFLPPDALRRQFAKAQGAGEVTVYCGSGVSATACALAMERAGLPRPRVYIGSFSEWCQKPGAPVETGDEPAGD